MNTQLKSTLMPSVALVCAVATCACTSTEESLLEMTVTEVGPGGGIARSSDGLLSVELPSGAIAQDTEITVTVFRDHGRPEVVSPIYDLGPDGLEFDAPVILTIQGPDAIGPFALANLDGATPAVLTDSIQDGSIVSGTLEHFSSYGVVVRSNTGTNNPANNPGTNNPANNPGTNNPGTNNPANNPGTNNPSNNPGPTVMTSSAAVTGGTTSVLLDLVALSAAGLDLSDVSDEVIRPGDLGPDSVAFPINPRTSTRSPGNFGNAPSTFVYDFVTFAPISGTIEHNGLLYFDQQFGSGNFTIGFDAARAATGINSGFFVESTTEGFLLIPGIFFDIANPSFVDAQPTSLVIEADVLIAPEMAAFLNKPGLAGTDVGDARIAATAQRF